jgi:DNA-binding transcriptional MerR regulator
MRTAEFANLFGVHPNTVRLYEEWGYLPPIPRDGLGQRVFEEGHVAQMRLARQTLHDAPRCGPEWKEVYKALVWLACGGQAQTAITQARKHLAVVKVARERAVDALAFLKGTLPERIAQLVTPPLSIQQAAVLIDVSVPVLRRWESYELIEVSRNPHNKYRMYGADEIGWLLVVRTLRQAGYTVAACRRSLEAHQANQPDLVAVIAACIDLFQGHETHTQAVLEQLQQIVLSR